jgi:transposase
MRRLSAPGITTMPRMKRQDGRRMDHRTREARRILAVQQVQGGQAPEAVIRALGLSRSSVYNWLMAYRSQGWDGLKAKKIGRPSKVTETQLRWIYRAVTEKNPLRLGFPWSLWTRGMIRALIAAQYGTQLSLSNITPMLARLGLNSPRPLAKASEQNRSAVEYWVENKYPAIQRAAKLEGADLFFAEESVIRSDFQESGVSAHMISAISPRGRILFMVTSKQPGAPVFIEFLERLLQSWGKPVFLVVNDQPYYGSRRVMSYLTGALGKLWFVRPYYC